MTPPERAPAPAERITVAIVGDLISTRPVAPMLATDAGFLAVVERLRAADVAVGNLVRGGRPRRSRGVGLVDPERLVHRIASAGRPRSA